MRGLALTGRFAMESSGWGRQRPSVRKGNAMRVLRAVLVLSAMVSSLLVGGTTASAAGSGNYTRSGGTLKPLNPSIIPPGSYASITVTGKCSSPGGTVRVRYNVSIAHDAVLVVNVSAGAECPKMMRRCSSAATSRPARAPASSLAARHRSAARTPRTA